MGMTMNRFEEKLEGTTAAESLPICEAWVRLAFPHFLTWTASLEPL